MPCPFTNTADAGSVAKKAVQPGTRGNNPFGGNALCSDWLAKEVF